MVASENGWLEYFLISFWGKSPIFRGELAISFREGNHPHLAVLDPEQKSLNGLFSLLNMESPKAQKVTLPETNIAPENRPSQ